MTPRAMYDARSAERLWQERFGSPARAHAVASETDAIFRITATNGGENFVLRIADDADGALDFQTALLMHLEAACPALPVPRVRLNVEGQAFTMLRAQGERQLVAVVMSFLPGKPLATNSMTPECRARVFEVLSLLDRSLGAFDHPGARRTVLWDVSEAGKILPWAEEIDDMALREKARGALLDWQTEAAPTLASLRRQVIHNDFNPSNILVDHQGHITGVIDFGDALWAPLVCDLATAAAYQEPDRGFSATLSSIVSHYEKNVVLTDTERAVLPALVRARAAMVAAIAHRQSARAPENRAYFMRNVPAASRLLTAAAKEIVL